MKTTVLAFTTVAALLVAGHAQASGGLFLTADYYHSDKAGEVNITLDGNNNGLSILQNLSNGIDRNILDVNIIGDLDGGPLQAAFDPPLTVVGLQPGRLRQTGGGNAMTFTVTGSRNLLAASQDGVHNVLTAMITGNSNQAAVSQTGSGNTLSFTQNGNGNRLTVIQRSSY
jgi:hypothetical protein